MNFAIERLKFDEVLLIRTKRFEDSRGYFMETWSDESFRRLGIAARFVQDNQSLSRPVGTVRGLHFQTPPYAQAKLVRVLHGAIFDVAVDLRAGSPTYGKWCGTTLSAERAEQLYIPKGFAHGFATMEPDTVIAYRVDAPYAPSCDSGIFWNDPQIAIDWPIDPDKAVLSAKDAGLPRLADFKTPFKVERIGVAASA